MAATGLAVHSVHSPGERRIAEMRAQGQCVTSPLFGAGRFSGPVPVLIEAQEAKTSDGGAILPPPTHESMPDG